MERLRRLRKSAAIRDMVRENHVRIEELIYPVFAMDGEDRVVPVSSMPGVSQYTVDRLPEVLEKISGAGIRAILLSAFPRTRTRSGARRMTKTASCRGRSARSRRRHLSLL